MLEFALLACLCAPWYRPADPAADALVLELGSRSFAQRQAADRGLAQLGRRALPALKQGQASADAEIAARCRRLVEAYYNRLPEGLQRWPWIDQMAGIALPVQRTYLERAGAWELGTCNYPDWSAWRQATQLWVRDLRHCGVPEAWIERALQGLAAKEEEWRRRHHATLLFTQ